MFYVHWSQLIRHVSLNYVCHPLIEEWLYLEYSRHDRHPFSGLEMTVTKKQMVANMFIYVLYLNSLYIKASLHTVSLDKTRGHARVYNRVWYYNEWWLLCYIRGIRIHAILTVVHLFQAGSNWMMLVSIKLKPFSFFFVKVFFVTKHLSSCKGAFERYQLTNFFFSKSIPFESSWHAIKTRFIFWQFSLSFHNILFV